MLEKETSPPGSPPGRAIEDIRHDADRLEQKVGDLSQSLDRIEKDLGEAAGETEP